MEVADERRFQRRMIGDYIIGPRIGKGSFAVVWRSRHRLTGMEVAVKEIDKKRLSQKISKKLLKEVSILSTINHPNIIRLFEVIQTDDRIFLILEYCAGGDLATYIDRHGKVSEAVARHFMRHLAAGLKVLQENHLIHRDLKPQNLLLSSNEATPPLKIGDFDFARSLKPQGLADTLCGSPLYMAPEIIQSRKYDGKADLWSVGAILFQLVTGKPPFNGNSQSQLFQKVLRTPELEFPEGALETLHPDCVDLCRSLLRQDPVERLTFKEFFNHKFLQEPRPTGVSVADSALQPIRSPAMQLTATSSENLPQIMMEQYSSHYSENEKLRRTGHDSSACTNSEQIAVSNITYDRLARCVPDDRRSGCRSASDSLELIEKDYVLVNPHYNSVGGFSCYLETSAQNDSSTRVSASQVKGITDTVAGKQTEAPSTSSTNIAESSKTCHPLATSCASLVREVQGLSILHPSTRLQLLCQYVRALSELSQEKCETGLYLDSFAVELVVLAVWKKALQISNSWLDSTAGSESAESSSAKESTSAQEDAVPASLSEGENVDFGRPSSVFTWAGQEFIAAVDRAEKLSGHVGETDGRTSMPDAMDIIFQEARTFGIRGAVDELMGNKDSAAVLYSKAIVLLSFIVGEATSLPLNPPFSLTKADRQRIHRYILNLQALLSKVTAS